MILMFIVMVSVNLRLSTDLGLSLVMILYGFFAPFVLVVIFIEVLQGLILISSFEDDSRIMNGNASFLAQTSFFFLLYQVSVLKSLIYVLLSTKRSKLIYSYFFNL